MGVLAAAVGIAACANILGIDDGIPRQDDASIDAPLDVGGFDSADAGIDVMDAGIDVPPSPLACGKATCNALVEVCCRKGDPLDASGQTFACIGDAAACTNGLVIVCDQAESCTALGHPGEECCAIVPDGGSVATSTGCVASSACKGAFMCQPGDDEICNVDAGQSCKPSTATVVGYDICK